MTWRTGQRSLSALMGAVYSNGVCNLSAAGATDSSKGLFFDRDSRIVRPVKMQMDQQSGQGSSMEVAFRDMQMWEKNIEDAPLNRRAWVVQKRLLSRANLLFGSKQLFWECREHRACEMFPEYLSIFNDYGAKNIKGNFRPIAIPNYKLNDLDNVISRLLICTQKELSLVRWISSLRFQVWHLICKNIPTRNTL